MFNGGQSAGVSARYCTTDEGTEGHAYTDLGETLLSFTVGGGLGVNQ